MKTEYKFVRERQIKEEVVITTEGSLEEALAEANNSDKYSTIAEYTQPAQMTVMNRIPEPLAAPAVDHVAEAIAEAEAERAAEAAEMAAHTVAEVEAAVAEVTPDEIPF